MQCLRCRSQPRPPIDDPRRVPYVDRIGLRISPESLARLSALLDVLYVVAKQALHRNGVGKEPQVVGGKNIFGLELAVIRRCVA